MAEDTKAEIMLALIHGRKGESVRDTVARVRSRTVEAIEADQEAVESLYETTGCTGCLIRLDELDTEYCIALDD